METIKHSVSQSTVYVCTRQIKNAFKENNVWKENLQCCRYDSIKSSNKHYKSNYNSTDVEIKLTVFQRLHNLANTCRSISKKSKC